VILHLEPTVKQRLARGKERKKNGTTGDTPEYEQNAGITNRESDSCAGMPSQSAEKLTKAGCTVVERRFSAA
jgi:hypothetical protein